MQRPSINVTVPLFFPSHMAINSAGVAGAEQVGLLKVGKMNET